MFTLPFLAPSVHNVFLSFVFRHKVVYSTELTIFLFRLVLLYFYFASGDWAGARPGQEEGGRVQGVRAGAHLPRLHQLPPLQEAHLHRQEQRRLPPLRGQPHNKHIMHVSEIYQTLCWCV